VADGYFGARSSPNTLLHHLLQGDWCLPARKGCSRRSAPPRTISTSLIPPKSADNFLVPYHCQETSPEERCARCPPRETTIAVLIEVYPPATDRSKIEFKSKPEQSWTSSSHGWNHN